MPKLRPLLILVVFILLIISVLRFENQRRENYRERVSVKNVPEFFLEQSLSTHYTQEGKIDYQMNSDYLEYFKQNETANIKNAYFIFYNDDGLSWHSRSDKAVLFNQSEDIQLSGNIRIWQPDRHLEITTETLLLSDSRSIAETSDVINLKSPSGNLKSKGMKVDMNAEKLQFLSGVQSQYQSTREKIKAPSHKKTQKIVRQKGPLHAK